MTDNQVDILLVEDNPDDAGLTLRALKKSSSVIRVKHVGDGEEAIEFLFGNAQGAMPKLILLDLKMPKVDGIDVLKRIKSDADKKVIPVVILTSSKEERDIVESYKLGVNAYIVKPVDFEKFSKTVTELGMFWLLINQTPVG